MRASLQKDHFVVLDSWRGVCALLVAAFHLDAAAHVYDLPLLRHAYLFVDFFFVLSGFVIAHAYTSRLTSGRDLLSFMVRRFGRIWPLQATLLGALVALEGLKLILYHLSGLKTGRPPFDPEGLYPLATIPDHLLLLQAMGLQDKLTWNFPSWSVSAEFWTYLIFATVCVIFPLWKRHIFVSLGLAGGMLVAIFSRHGMDVTYDLGFFRCLLGFMVGSLVYGLREKAWRLLAPCGALAEGGALLAVLAFVWFAGYGPLSFFAPLVFGLATLVFGLEGGPFLQSCRVPPSAHWATGHTRST